MFGTLFECLGLFVDVLAFLFGLEFNSVGLLRAIVVLKICIMLNVHDFVIEVTILK